MIVAYLTHDEVNQDLARRLADTAGMLLSFLFIRDEGMIRSFDVILFDLDCLPASDRQLILKGLLAGPLTSASGDGSGVVSV